MVWVSTTASPRPTTDNYPLRVDGSYIIGAKMRGASHEAAKALSRQGRYRTVAGNLRVRQVCVSTTKSAPSLPP